MTRLEELQEALAAVEAALTAAWHLALVLDTPRLGQVTAPFVNTLREEQGTLRRAVAQEKADTE